MRHCLTADTGLEFTPYYLAQPLSAKHAVKDFCGHSTVGFPKRQHSLSSIDYQIPDGPQQTPHQVGPPGFYELRRVPLPHHKTPINMVAPAG